MRRPASIEGLGGVLLFLAVWELCVRSDWLAYQFLPSPSAVALGFKDLLLTRPLAEEILHTLTAVFLGWLIAAAVGVSMGLALGLSAGARRYTLATIEVLRTLPGIAFVPLALLLFGFSLRMELAVIIFPALWPVLVNTFAGVAAVPERLRDVATVLRLAPLDAVAKVYLPAAAPSILVGLRLSLTLALVLAVIAEMLGNPEGLGYAVTREQQGLNPELMFAYVITIGFLGIALNAAIVGAARLALPGRFGPAELGTSPG